MATSATRRAGADPRPGPGLPSACYLSARCMQICSGRRATGADQCPRIFTCGVHGIHGVRPEQGAEQPLILGKRCAHRNAAMYTLLTSSEGFARPR